MILHLAACPISGGQYRILLKHKKDIRVQFLSTCFSETALSDESIERYLYVFSDSWPQKYRGLDFDLFRSIQRQKRRDSRTRAVNPLIEIIIDSYTLGVLPEELLRGTPDVGRNIRNLVFAANAHSDSIEYLGQTIHLAVTLSDFRSIRMILHRNGPEKIGSDIAKLASRARQEMLEELAIVYVDRGSKSDKEVVEELFAAYLSHGAIEDYIRILHETRSDRVFYKLCKLIIIYRRIDEISTQLRLRFLKLAIEVDERQAEEQIYDRFVDGLLRSTQSTPELLIYLVRFHTKLYGLDELQHTELYRRLKSIIDSEDFAVSRSTFIEYLSELEAHDPKYGVWAKLYKYEWNEDDRFEISLNMQEQKRLNLIDHKPPSNLWNTWETLSNKPLVGVGIYLWFLVALLVYFLSMYR